MHAQEIINLITQRQPLTDETLSKLQNLTEKYPYFSAAQVLFTLNLKSRDDSRWDASLLKSACYIGDRQQLFYLIETLPAAEEPSELAPSDDAPAPSDYAPVQPDDAPVQPDYAPVPPDDAPVQPDDAPVPSDDAPVPSDDAPVQPDDVPKQDSHTVAKPDTEKSAPPVDQAAVIDSFLSRQPGNQPTELVYAVVHADYAEKFLMDAEDLEDDAQTADTEEFLTETLAKIYIKQKKYEQALKIIRQLNLDNPEKSCYFADQIRFLEKLINNSKK